jgi:hypothetical protein
MHALSLETRPMKRETETIHNAPTEAVEVPDTDTANILQRLRHIERFNTFFFYALLVVAFLLFLNGVFLGIVAYLMGR